MSSQKNFVIYQFRGVSWGKLLGFFLWQDLLSHTEKCNSLDTYKVNITQEVGPSILTKEVAFPINFNVLLAPLTKQQVLCMWDQNIFPTFLQDTFLGDDIKESEQAENQLPRDRNSTQDH